MHVAKDARGEGTSTEQGSGVLATADIVFNTSYFARAFEVQFRFVFAYCALCLVQS